MKSLYHKFAVNTRILQGFSDIKIYIKIFSSNLLNITYSAVFVAGKKSVLPHTGKILF